MSDPYVILFTAGRELFNKVPKVREELESLIRARVQPGRLVMIRHGDCPGKTSGDNAVNRWVREFGEEFQAYTHSVSAVWDDCVPKCPQIPDHRRIKSSDDIFHPGERGSYCPGAGPRRNAQMVGMGADVCLAMPMGLSYGTKGCARLAKKAGIEVVWRPLD